VQEVVALPAYRVHVLARSPVCRAGTDGSGRTGSRCACRETAEVRLARVRLRRPCAMDRRPAVPRPDHELPYARRRFCAGVRRAASSQPSSTSGTAARAGYRFPSQGRWAESISSD